MTPPAPSGPIGTSLIIGASRGLGLALVEELVRRGSEVIATVRSEVKEDTFPKGVDVIEGVDVGTPDAGKTIVSGLAGRKVDLVVLVAGVLKPETFDEPKWEDEELMYKVCAIGPVFVASALYVPFRLLHPLLSALLHPLLSIESVP